MIKPQQLLPHPITVTGQENIISPGFYMPNRLTVASGKALHHLLDGKVCYLVDPTFPPAEEIMAYLKLKGVEIAYFDFRRTTSRAVREQIMDRLSVGKSVVFLPGQAAKCRGCIADVPAPFLMTVGSLHISPVPVFVGLYTNKYYGTFTNDVEPGCHEEMCILPKLHTGPQTGERLLSAWMQKGCELFSANPFLSTSLTTDIVRSMHANAKVEITDGMTGAKLPFFKALGVSMTVAGLLKKRGDKRIGVIIPPGAGGVIATVSCLLAGVTPVLINYATSKAAFESTVRQAGLTTFVSARKFKEKLPTFPWPEDDKMIFVEDLLKNLDKKKLIANVLMAKLAPAALICKRFDTEARRNNDEAIMLFTSGSSGEPKGVVLTHRMVKANVAQCCSRLTLDRPHRFLGSLPIFHSFGLTVTMMLPLLMGYPIVSYPNPTDARTLNELIKKYQLTLVCSTPTFARAMLRRAKEGNYDSVVYFIVGAEKLQDDLDKGFREMGVRLMEGYGLTEAAPVCGVNVPDAEKLPNSSFYIPGMVKGSIGAMFPGIAVKVTDVDDDTKELAITERGMLWFKGANIFNGYVGKPEMNSEIFKDGWFKTGDIGSLDLNGFLHLGGRLSRFSKVGGEMVPHEGVEQAITEALGITSDEEGALQIAVTGVTDPQKGEALVLLSALPQHQRMSEEKAILTSIRNALAEREIPTLWAPKYVVPVESIPVLPTGKLDLRSCKMLAEEALGENDREA